MQCLSRARLPGGMRQIVGARHQSSIAVIGSGITGVTTARALMARGFDVTVYDRHRMEAMETSFANGGQLSASNAEVWNSWGTVLKGIKWMFQSDAPLLMNPWPSWHKYSWCAEFVAQIPMYKANTVETVRLAIQARELLLKHAEDYNFDFNAEHRGILHFYMGEKDYQHAEYVTKLYAEGGLERYPVTPAEMREIDPALDPDTCAILCATQRNSAPFHARISPTPPPPPPPPLRRYIGGFFTPSDFTGDIHKYSVGLAKGIKERGVKFNCGIDEGRVKELRAHNGKVDVVLGDPAETFAGPTFYGGRTNKRAKSRDGEVHTYDGVVVCAGVRSRDLAAQLGDRVNIYPVKGYSITVNMNDAQSQNAAPWVSLLDDEAKIVTSRLGKDRFRIAGTAEFNGYNRDTRHRDTRHRVTHHRNTHHRPTSAATATASTPRRYNRDIRHDRIVPLVRWCNTHFPEISTEDITPWSGVPHPTHPTLLPPPQPPPPLPPPPPPRPVPRPWQGCGR